MHGYSTSNGWRQKDCWRLFHKPITSGCVKIEHVFIVSYYAFEIVWKHFSLHVYLYCMSGNFLVCFFKKIIVILPIPAMPSEYECFHIQPKVVCRVSVSNRTHLSDFLFCCWSVSSAKLWVENVLSFLLFMGWVSVFCNHYPGHLLLVIKAVILRYINNGL